MQWVDGQHKGWAHSALAAFYRLECKDLCDALPATGPRTIWFNAAEVLAERAKAKAKRSQSLTDAIQMLNTWISPRLMRNLDEGGLPWKTPTSSK